MNYGQHTEDLHKIFVENVICPALLGTQSAYHAIKGGIETDVIADISPT